MKRRARDKSIKSCSYDTILKDMFERDRPSMLNELTGGVAIRGFLNVELPKVIDRRMDCVAELVNDQLCHIEFQSQNLRKMPIRQGIYGLLVADKFNCRVDQTVVYMGTPPLQMEDSIDAGSVKVKYRLFDIRIFKAEDLARSANPADRALAILGAGSEERIREVLSAAAALDEPLRQRTLLQLSILAGLRGLSERVIMELDSMNMEIDISQHAFLQSILDRGRAEGKVEGKAEGELKFILKQMKAKFGRIPAWADHRLLAATPSQLNRWTLKILTADTIEGVLGRRPSKA